MSNRVCCIHQPPFLPWLGVAESMLVCDVFIALDDVQYEAGGVQNRNRIKTPLGAAWLTVPVRPSFGQLVSDVAISNSLRLDKLLRTVELNYANAPHFRGNFDRLAEVLIESRWQRLVDLNMALLELLRDTLCSECTVVRASALGVPTTDKRVRLPNLCVRSDTRWIYSGSGMREYMPDAEQVYGALGVDVIWHDYQWRHEVYPQQFGALGFAPCLSWIDMWFNCGAADMRRRLLRSGKNTLDTRMGLCASNG
jgi:hypothetical protein